MKGTCSFTRGQYPTPLAGRQGARLSVKYSRLAQSKQFVLLPFYPSHTLDFDACSALTEMHDRMIAADARRTKATLLTRDSQIASSAALDAFNAEGTLQPERVEMVN